MKLGNVSQSIVPVPKYFLNNKSIDLIPLYSKTEANFSPKRKTRKKDLKNKSYYRQRDILSLNLDFNINHNPRINHKSFNLNKKKYIPIYYLKKYKNNAEIKNTYFPDIIYINNINNIKTIKTFNDKEKKNTKTNLQQYKEYLMETNIEKKINPDLRYDLINNTKNLISKINMNFDLKRWDEFDTRITSNLYHQPAFSPLTDFNKNEKSDKDLFTETLKEKAKSLRTISNKAKIMIEKNLDKNELEKNENEYEKKINKRKIEIMIENSKNNLLKLKYNNIERPLYNEEDKKFIMENKSITSRLNRTKLYKAFPSPLKEEFIEKRIYKNKNLFNK